MSSTTTTCRTDLTMDTFHRITIEEGDIPGRFNDPFRYVPSRAVISAAKVINFTAALVSMLSLETAMLAQFGGAEEVMFRRIMTGATGGVVCAAVLGAAIFMIVQATKQLKRMK